MRQLCPFVIFHTDRLERVVACLATIVTDNYHLVSIVAKDTSLTKRTLNWNRAGTTNADVRNSKERQAKHHLIMTNRLKSVTNSVCIIWSSFKGYRHTPWSRSNDNSFETDGSLLAGLVHFHLRFELIGSSY